MGGARGGGAVSPKACAVERVLDGLLKIGNEGIVEPGMGVIDSPVFSFQRFGRSLVAVEHVRRR